MVLYTPFYQQHLRTSWAERRTPLSTLVKDISRVVSVLEETDVFAIMKRTHDSFKFKKGILASINIQILAHTSQHLHLVISEKSRLQNKNFISQIVFALHCVSVDAYEII